MSLTDANPSRFDLTVPKSFRRSVPIPKALRLHRGEVPPGERVELFGVPATNALRTIIDVWKEGSMPREELRAAFREAARRGQITRTEIANARKDADYGPILTEIRKAKSQMRP